MATPPFVDIHVHPDLKSFLSSNDEIDRKDCWKNIIIPPRGQMIDDLVLGNILESQSSLNQLNHSSGTIALTGLYAFERAMIKGDLEELPIIHVNLVTVAFILKLFHYPDLLNYELMKRIKKCRTRYFSLFSEAHSHLQLSRLIPPEFNVLKNISEYNASSSKLNIILTIEGGHNLFKKTCGLCVRKKILANINELKTGRYRFLFIGLAHIERNSLCNHAYAIKLLHHRNFLPVGCGITRLGKKAIRKILSNPNRILIDIKHMSLKARKEYYDMLEKDFRNERIPIVASHVGVTGRSYNNIEFDDCRTYCRWTEVLHKQANGIIPGTTFNPWSVNLYDEEILKIIESDGLIGLSLDARILGARQKYPKDRIEYFSKREFPCPGRERHPISQINHIDHESELPLSELEKAEHDLEKLKEDLIEYIQNVIRHPKKYQDFKEEYKKIETAYDNLSDKRQQLSTRMHVTDLKHLCNNILHIVKTGGDRAWKHICIGSDFDGLVSAVECCKNATEYGNLKQELIQLLTDLAQSTSVLTNITNINQKVDDIMSGNAYNFLLKYFT